MAPCSPIKMDSLTTSKIALVLIILAICFTETSGRYSSYRGSSSYRASTSYRSYRSYRSSYSSYRSYYSSYRSYVPVRYGRVYSGVYGYYYTYYYRYFYYRPGVAGYRSSTSTGSVCRNYEADSNGTALGLFNCPLPFEPSDFTYCCGQSNAEYCCKFIDHPGNLAGIIIGCILIVVVIAVIVLCIYKCSQKPQRTVSHYNSTTVTTSGGGRGMRMQNVNSRPQVQPPPQYVAYGQAAPPYGPPPQPYGQPPPNNWQNGGYPSEKLSYGFAPQPQPLSSMHPAYPPGPQPQPQSDIDPAYPAQPPPPYQPPRY